MLLAFMMWGLAVAFYLFGFFHRVTPAVLTSELMRDFSLTAAMLGNLSAFYFYFYAGMQIPTGVLVDHYGPRKILSIGALIGGIGALLFAFADSFASSAIGRGLIGGTVAVAWVSLLKLSTNWFDARRLGMVTGIALAIGTMGAVLAGLPLRVLSDAYGWRNVIGASGFIALVLALAIFLLMRDDPSDSGFDSHAGTSPQLAQPSVLSILKGMAEIWRYRNVTLLFWAQSGLCGAFLTFAGLWGVPFFVQQHGLTAKSASLITSGMLIAFSCGGILLGMLSDKLRKRKPPFVLGGACVVLGFGALYVAPDLPLTMLVPLLLLGGFGSGSMVIGFLHGKESAPLRLAGTVAGAINMGVMVGPLVQQPAIGWILDHYWGGMIIDGIRLYDMSAFKLAFAFLFVWVLTSFVALLLTRESNCRQYRN
ncbi:MAG: MFS transporter [Burkholderiales bacterium RIFCSPLOWO2_02_FULL_57_36]|nr:MAG: MFS transporter [Burkholderiales bacterium RIFCSPLOWO2_02_FULL_57_36]